MEGIGVDDDDDDDDDNNNNNNNQANMVLGQLLTPSDLTHLKRLFNLLAPEFFFFNFSTSCI